MAIEQPPEWAKEYHRHLHDAIVKEESDRLRFQQDIALAALKALTISNGGAMIALFTFIGSSAKFDHRAIWWGFVWFVAGLVCVISAHIGGYFSQATFMDMMAHRRFDTLNAMMGIEQRNEDPAMVRKGNIYLASAIILAIGSLVFFAVGSATVLSGVLP